MRPICSFSSEFAAATNEDGRLKGLSIRPCLEAKAENEEVERVLGHRD
jgi:hypothetical protein